MSVQNSISSASPRKATVPANWESGSFRLFRTLRVLYLEDDLDVVEVVSRILLRGGGDDFQIVHFTLLHEALPELAFTRPGDVMLLDLNLPDSQGADTFNEIRKACPDLPLVILTGEHDEELAMRAVREGAQDYLLKNEIKMSGLLARVLHYAVDRQAYLKEIEASRQLLEEQNIRLEKALKNLERTSAALVESEKIKSLGQMAAGIAHELKNPLAILRMGLDYLARVKPEKCSGAVQKVLPDLFAALSRSDGIIANMMDYSAPRSMHPEMMSLNLLIEEAAEIMETHFIKFHIAASMDLAPALPELELDRQKIIQLLINLIGNAVQAMPDGGRLHVSTKASSLVDEAGRVDATADSLPDPVLVIVEIHDSGPGIPEEILPRIFDPFFTTKGNSGGTGLGLAVCAMIMDLHGGKLEVTNHPDGGAVARLTFIV